MKVEAVWSNGEIQIPLVYTVESSNGSDHITEFNPKPLKDQLYGQALLAHNNFQNLLREVLVQFPTKITVTRIIQDHE